MRLIYTYTIIMVYMTSGGPLEVAVKLRVWVSVKVL